MIQYRVNRIQQGVSLGASLVEFALSVTLLLMLTLGCLEFGLYQLRATELYSSLSQVSQDVGHLEATVAPDCDTRVADLKTQAQSELENVRTQLGVDAPAWTATADIISLIDGGTSQEPLALKLSVTWQQPCILCQMAPMPNKIQTVVVTVLEDLNEC